MKFAILNQPLGNRGDEAAHRAFISRMSLMFLDDDIDIIFFNKGSINLSTFIREIRVVGKNVIYREVSGISYGLGKVIKLSLMFNSLVLSYVHPISHKFIKQLKEYDCVICAPGGICMGGFLDWEHIWQLFVAKKLNIPIFYWGRSVGPFESNSFMNFIFKKRSEELISSFKYISVRDEISYNITKKLTPRCHLMVDSAFLLKPTIKVPDEIKNQIGGGKYLVFVPNELTWHYHFKECNQKLIDEFYINIIKMIRKDYSDYQIVMMPQTFGTSVNDFSYFQKIKEAANVNEIIIIPESVNSEIQEAIIRDSSLVIGARYHSIVFAINNNTPFIALSYEHKLEGMLNLLGLDSQIINIRNIFNDDQDAYQTCLTRIHALLSSQVSCMRELASQMANSAFDILVAEIQAIDTNTLIH